MLLQSYGILAQEMALVLQHHRSRPFFPQTKNRGMALALRGQASKRHEQPQILSNF